MGLKSLTTPSIIKLNSLLFICNNISYVTKFVKCGLLLLRGAIHKTLSGLIKPLKQSYYRLRLISTLGCHLLTSCKFLNTCRFYTPPISTLTRNVFMVEVKGFAPLSSMSTIFAVNGQFIFGVLD